MSKEAIKIKCKGAAEVDFREIKPFQGNLKDLSKENYEKLKKQILTIGFKEPITVWKKDGELLALNGHQRLRAIQEMQKEGYLIPLIPISIADCSNEKEAKKTVLSLTAQYGEITTDGLHEFMHSAGLEFPDLENLRFPEIDLKKFFQSYGPEDKSESKKEKECPNCGHIF